MLSLSRLLKRHTLWLGFVAVLGPLIVLLALQYQSLDKLKNLSAVSQQAALNNYLEAVGAETQYFYLARAERALNLPASLFLQQRYELAAAGWSHRPVEGARSLFLVDFSRDPLGTLLVYDPVDGVMKAPLPSAESQAIMLAVGPWQVGGSATPRATAGLKVDERDPGHRMILNPILDDSSHVVGVAGMIISEDYFKLTLLPAAIQKTFPGYFPDAARNDLVIRVRDAGHNVVMASRNIKETREAVSRHFPFVFTDWTLNLHSGNSTPEQWARTQFGINLTLFLIVAVVLLLALGMALNAADRTMKLSELKSEFVSNVSHELRTPLASILVFAELLRTGRTQDPDRVREYGEYIEAESRRLSRLITNILDFSRIESGRKTYQFVRADVARVVTSVLRTFEVRLAHSGFRVRYSGPDGPLPPVQFDPDAIGQALHNLIDNAEKYSGEARDIQVRLERSGEWIVISVTDQGIGIPREEQKKIFERFHRAGTVLVHDVKGAGLGLAIVRHIVEAHHGRVTVDSEPGRGSTFAIHLPVGGGAAETPDIPEAPVRAAR